MSARVSGLTIFANEPSDVEDVRWMPERAEELRTGADFVVPASVCVDLGNAARLYLSPEAAGQLAAGLLAALASADDTPPRGAGTP